MRLFKNRVQAAHELAGDLQFLKHEDPLILGIPNGGLQIAAIVAERLDAALDILLIQKLSAPGHTNQVVGAVDEHGRISMIQSAARWHHLTSQEMIGPARLVFGQLQKRRARFRAILPATDVRGRTVIIVDHGVETGATMLAAIASVRDRGARKVAVAAPAGAGKATWQLHDTADVVVIPHTPSKFKGIDHFYESFEEVPDDLVASTLERWSAARPEQHAGVKTLVARFPTTQSRVIHCELDLPPGTKRGSGPYPAVIFAHGLESDGHSPRSVPISRRLAKRGIIGVRMDFTGHGRSEGSPKDATGEQMLADLRAVFENVRNLDEVYSQQIGLNGSGTGGMIALCFAASTSDVAALVLRGPVFDRDLREARQVTAPTLLIHAERDTALADTASAIARELTCTHELLKIPESNRLFNDPISRELMVSASVDWLADHLTAASSAAAPTIETNRTEPSSPVGESAAAPRDQS